MTITSIDQQLGEQPIKPSITVPHFEANDNALPDQSKVLGFEFATEPVEIQHPVKGVNTDIHGKPITAKVFVDWCKAYSMRKEKPVEVSPETEQQKETIADCGKKTLMDNPSLADNIGSHMNLAFDYAKKLVNENTRLRAQLYRLPMLEQENAELKADNLKARNYINELTELLGKSQMTIADLEAQLAAKNEPLSNAEQLPKEPTYDADWLANAVNNYDNIYWLIGVNINVGGITMSANNSAHIILRAVAKEFNGGEIGTQFIYIDHEGNYAYCKSGLTNSGEIRFVDAQRAIDILNQIDPQILKNYFA